MVWAFLVCRCRVFGDALKTQQVKYHTFFLWYGYKKKKNMQSIIKVIAFLIFIALSVYFAEGQARDFGMFFILIFSVGIGYYLFYYSSQKESQTNVQIESKDLHICKEREEYKKEVNLYTNDYDYLLHNILPNSSTIILDSISKQASLDNFQAKIILNRWKHFHLIDYVPYEDEWVPTIPNQTLTVEQFKKLMDMPKICVKKVPETSELYFDYGINKKGIVINKEIPKCPMLSQITCSNSLSFWILHEEGQLFAPPTIMQF